MFAHQPQSHHLSRSYGGGAPGTSRRGGRDKENAGVLPSKTPVRLGLGGGPLKPQQTGLGTVGRLGAKTIDRNILAPKGPDPSDDIAPKRLFQTVVSKPNAAAGPSRSKTPAPTRSHTLRTPAPARRHEPSPTPLPSAQRTRRRSRASLHASPERSFATPAPRWDEEVSLDSILEADIEAVIEEGGAGSESDYELEYAPPPIKDRPFVPVWADSIPDPVQSLAQMASMRAAIMRAPPSPPPMIAEVPAPTMVLCDENELEHPVLRRKAAPATAAARPGLNSSCALKPSAPRPPTAQASKFIRPASTIRAPSSSETSSLAGRGRPGTAVSRSVNPPVPSARSSTSTSMAPPRLMKAASTTTLRPTNPSVRTAAPRPLSLLSRGTPRSVSGSAPTSAARSRFEQNALADLAEIDLGGLEFDLDLDAIAPEPVAEQDEGTAPEADAEKEPTVDVEIAAPQGMPEPDAPIDSAIVAATESADVTTGLTPVQEVPVAVVAEEPVERGITMEIVEPIDAPVNAAETPHTATPTESESEEPEHRP